MICIFYVDAHSKVSDVQIQKYCFLWQPFSMFTNNKVEENPSSSA